jgi:hypothetical protein
MVPFFVWHYHGGYEFVDLYWMIMQASPELVPDLLRLSLNDALTYDKVCVFSHFEGQKEVFGGHVYTFFLLQHLLSRHHHSSLLTPQVSVEHTKYL